ncbi:hypothetical protein ACN1C3_07195 [Pseudomonas sp. H11T01]|uniref:hypothetical protein n=1 Tax=Pseudomonas sp. H11T01 TaxID=3402749 RepID=UPI003AC84325
MKILRTHRHSRKFGAKDSTADRSHAQQRNAVLDAQRPLLSLTITKKIVGILFFYSYLSPDSFFVPVCV